MKIGGVLPNNKRIRLFDYLLCLMCKHINSSECLVEWLIYLFLCMMHIVDVSQLECVEECYIPDQGRKLF